MLTTKIIIYTFIFLTSSLIGTLISRKYVNRVNDLQEFKNALNIFKTKIRYTYETIPEIFREISKNVKPSVGYIFHIAAREMSILAARWCVEFSS